MQLKFWISVAVLGFFVISQVIVTGFILFGSNFGFWLQTYSFHFFPVTSWTSTGKRNTTKNVKSTFHLKNLISNHNTLFRTCDKMQQVVDLTTDLLSVFIRKGGYVLAYCLQYLPKSTFMDFGIHFIWKNKPLRAIIGKKFFYQKSGSHLKMYSLKNWQIDEVVPFVMECLIF